MVKGVILTRRAVNLECGVVYDPPGRHENVANR